MVTNLVSFLGTSFFNRMPTRTICSNTYSYYHYYHHHHHQHRHHHHRQRHHHLLLLHRQHPHHYHRTAARSPDIETHTQCLATAINTISSSAQTSSTEKTHSMSVFAVIFAIAIIISIRLIITGDGAGRKTLRRPATPRPQGHYPTTRISNVGT